MTVTPIVLLAASQQRKLESRILESIRSWLNDWFVDEPIAEVSLCEPGYALDGWLEAGGEFLVTACSEALIDVQWRLADERKAALFGRMVGRPREGDLTTTSSEMIEKVIQDAFADLWARIFAHETAEVVLRHRAFSQVNMPIGEYSFFRLDIRLDEVSLGVWIPRNTLIEHQLQRETPETVNLTEPTMAMGRQPVNLHLTLGEAELTLAELNQLCVGDVIRLDQRLEEPLFLRVADANSQIAGRLGRKGDHYAFLAESLTEREQEPS